MLFRILGGTGEIRISYLLSYTIYRADLIKRLINNTPSAQWIRSKIRLERLDFPPVKSIVRRQTSVQPISCNLTYCRLVENSYYIF